MRGEATTHVLRRFGRVLRSLETRSASRRIRTDDAAVIEAGEGAGSKAGCGVDLLVADEGRRRRRTTKFANMRHGRVLGGHAGVCEDRTLCGHAMPMCEGRAMREVRGMVVQRRMAMRVIAPVV